MKSPDTPAKAPLPPRTARIGWSPNKQEWVMAEEHNEADLEHIEAVPIILLSEHSALLAQEREKAFREGMMHRSVPRGMVSVHGTDGCSNCETGRITLYAASRYCTECEHEAARKGSAG